MMRMEKKFIAILIITLVVASLGGLLASQVTFVPKSFTTTKIFTTTLPQLTRTRIVTITTTIPVREPIYTPVKRNVEIRVEGVIIYYCEELFWNENYFSEITNNKTEFSSFLIERFEQDLSKYGDRKEYAIETDVKFNETQRSTIFTCEVHGAISKSYGSYHATFFWLLRPLELDFIDEHFEHPKRSLYWEGYVEGISTKIFIELPVSVTAWDHSNGHCHAHVWWEEK